MERYAEQVAIVAAARTEEIDSVIAPTPDVDAVGAASRVACVAEEIEAFEDLAPPDIEVTPHSGSDTEAPFIGRTTDCYIGVGSWGRWVGAVDPALSRLENWRRLCERAAEVAESPLWGSANLDRMLLLKSDRTAAVGTSELWPIDFPPRAAPALRADLRPLDIHVAPGVDGARVPFTLQIRTKTDALPAWPERWHDASEINLAAAAGDTVSILIDPSTSLEVRTPASSEWSPLPVASADQGRFTAELNLGDVRGGCVVRGVAAPLGFPVCKGLISLTLSSPRRLVREDDDPPTITALTTEEGRFETWMPSSKRALLKAGVDIDPSFHQSRWATPVDAGSGVVELRLTEPARRRVACEATIERKGGGALVVDFIGQVAEPLPALGLVEFGFDGCVAHLPAGCADEASDLVGLMIRRGFRVRSVSAVVRRGKPMNVWSTDAQCQMPRGLVKGRAVGLQATGRYVIGVSSDLDSEGAGSDVIGVGADGAVGVGPWRLCTAPGRDGAFYVPDVPFGEVEVGLWFTPDDGSEASSRRCALKCRIGAESRSASLVLNG